MPELGQFFKGYKFNTRHWICNACLETPEIQRQLRKDKESPIERTVRNALLTLKIHAVAEYPLGKWIFDFCIERLRLLIEVDSITYHRLRKSKDDVKTSFAENLGWKVIRLHPSQHLGNDAIKCVLQRKSELGM
jgi:very-short-patch-repair endonuclease